jgi:hypothetical protein
MLGMTGIELARATGARPGPPAATRSMTINTSQDFGIYRIRHWVQPDTDSEQTRTLRSCAISTRHIANQHEKLQPAPTCQIVNRLVGPEMDRA